MSLIAFEGCDKVGKSTLINAIKGNTAVYHVTKPFAPLTIFSHYIRGEYETIGKLSKLFPDKNLILDRYFISEYAYSKLEKDKKVLKEKDLTYIDKLDKYVSTSAVLILVVADSKKVKKRLVETNEKSIKKKDVNILLNAYDYYYIRSHIPKIRIDTTSKGVEENAKEIREFLKEKGIKL